MAEGNKDCKVGCGSRTTAKPLNAQEWVANSGGYKTGTEPKEGAVIVYGNTGTAGHVAYVNEIKEDGTLVLIESGYGRTNKAGIWYREVKPSNNYFISKTAGNLIGFIYPKTAVKAPTTSENKKTVEVIAQEVIDGKWGNYPSRKALLEKAGYNYYQVQTKVNQLLTKKDTIETVAREVIRGIWGNGEARKYRLTQAGYDYNEIQKKVNELLKR